MDRSHFSAGWLTVGLAFAGCAEHPDDSRVYSESAQLPEKYQPITVPVTDDPVAPGEVAQPGLAATPVAKVVPVVSVPEAPVAGLPNPLPSNSDEPKVPIVELTYRVPPPPPKAIALVATQTEILPSREMKLLIPEKTFKPERGAIRVTFDDVDLLKVLNVEPVPNDIEKSLPGWLSGLSGQRIRIRGWMFPPPISEGLKGFAFVRDNEICCFGREAKIYDKIAISMKDGTTARYIEGRPFDVLGTMHVKSRFLGEKLFYLYTISDAEVIDR